MIQHAAKSLQSCSTLCDPTDGSPPGSPVPGILQARTLEWVAISFSNAWKWKNKVKSLSLVQLLVTPWTAAHQAPPSMGFSRQEYWSGVPSPSLVIQQRDAIFLRNPLYWNINELWAFCWFCRWTACVYLGFSNISLPSRLPSSILKVYLFGHLLWNWSRSYFPGLGLFLIALGDEFQKTSQWSHPNPKRPWSLYPSSHFLPMFSLRLS